MTFQLMDTKHECIAVFKDGKIYSDINAVELDRTWSPSANLPSTQTQYASIYAMGKGLDKVCPEDVKDRWQKCCAKASAFIKSFYNAKISLDEVCFYDLVPEKFLLDYYGIKNEITNYVFENFERPKNYDFLVDLHLLTQKIKKQPLSINIKNLDFSNSKVRNSLSKVKDASKHIDYNMWGTVTGRLATNPSSFPILTLNKELRSCIEPNNDCFVELDFNSAELRVLLALLGQEQPKEDIHSWVSQNVFMGKHTRAESKVKTFAWLYNPKARNKKLNEKFDRDSLLEKHYDVETVSTPFGRSISCDKTKAVNYLIQSTTSDLFLTNVFKVDTILKNRKSYVAFCIHDSLVLDFSKEDKDLLDSIIKEFSTTKFGEFRSNLSLGKNFGDMREIK
tara:strand:+ start:8645 stop:9823 length:1179 start_codon:yes stop_codon:yes gene_type:complete